MRKFIAYLDAHLLRHEPFVQYVTEILVLLDFIGAGAVGVKTVTDELKLIFAQVVANLDYILKSGFTEKLKEQDRIRDDVSRGLTALVKSFLHQSDPATRDAATQLMLVLDHYWSIPQRAYDDETAAIDDLLRELALATNAPRVTLLGLTGTVARLRAANDEFSRLMRERYSEETQRPDMSMKDARAATEQKLRELTDRVESIATLNGLDFTPELAAFVKECNVITARYKRILAQEKGRRKAAAKGDEGNGNEGNDEGNDEGNENETPDEGNGNEGNENETPDEENGNEGDEGDE